ncbi:peptide N-acetyl-beta-D-glucosaminyl asparaginase amidase A-domain-containing protein [Scleroderma citrinum]
MLSRWKVLASFASLLFSVVPSSQVLVDFQVAQPPPVPSDAKTCTIKIFERTFGNSYYDPEIVQYTPPTDCGEPGSWAAVTLNFTVTSNGTQYDRLGVFTFHNTEIWCTSTPEPTKHGIIWTYIKDVTRYIPLFSKPGTLLLELDNIVNSKLTGQYATTLHATFYVASGEHPTAGQSNLIVPISTLSDKLANDASVPPAFSLNVTLPQNTVEIYAELYASGNAQEEFWYGNVANDYIGDLPADTTYGGGPFREVRLLVDGILAGVAFPYAVIFTGGINPAVWKPITSYGAIDLPTYFLDLTPFAPVFADGLPHNVSIDVVSAEVNHTINHNWYVSGLLQVITHPSGRRTTGQMISYDAQPYAVTQTYGSVSQADVTVTVKAQRHLHIESLVVSGDGTENYVVFEQNLDYTNTQYYLNYTNTQNIAQVSSGSVKSTHNGVPVVVDNFEYPLFINLTYLDVDSTFMSFLTSFDLSYNRQLLPAPFILGSDITEHQLATGFFAISSAGNTGSGDNNNTFSYVDSQQNTYNRVVDAVLNKVVYDQQSGTLASGSYNPSPFGSAQNGPGSLSVPPARLPGGKTLGIWL